MAKVVVIHGLWTGLGTLTLKLFRRERHASYSNATRDTQANGAAETAAEETNRKGSYVATGITNGAAGDLSGPHLVQVYDSGNNWLADFWADMTGVGTTAIPIVAVNSVVDAGQVSGDDIAAQTIAAMNAAFKRGAVDDATFSPTTTVFETTRTDNSDEYEKQALLWTSGPNAGLTSRIASYTFSANSKDELTLSEALPNTPTDGDTFYVLGRIE